MPSKDHHSGARKFAEIAKDYAIADPADVQEVANGARYCSRWAVRFYTDPYRPIWQQLAAKSSNLSGKELFLVP